ncbi:MAG: PEP-CTERM sorting domain-containing protein [Pseudomonadota bacterium]
MSKKLSIQSIMLAVVTALVAPGASAIVVGPFGDLTNWVSSATRISGSGGNFNGVDAVAALVGDDLTDGAINIGTSDKFGLFFDTGIVNNAGADLVVFDSRFSADSLYMEIEIGGSEFLVGAGSFIDTGLDFTLKNCGCGFSLFGAAIDLSDWGIANGATVTNLAIRGSGQSDIMGVAALHSVAVPEPAAFAFFGLGIAGLMASRRRKLKVQ